MKASLVALALSLGFVLAGTSPHAQQGRSTSVAMDTASAPSAGVLMPTRHPPLPQELSELWFAPSRGASASKSAAPALASAFRLTVSREYTKALTLASQAATQDGTLGQYASYYAGVSQLNLGRPADALKTFRALRGQKLVGYLTEAAAFGEAEALGALGDVEGAIKIYEGVAQGKPSYVEDSLMRLGRAYKAAGHSGHAADIFTRVYYEFAMSEFAAEAGTEVALSSNVQPITEGSQRYQLELGRADRLFGARQYEDARDGYVRVQRVASDADADRILLRIAECDFHLRRYRNAREGVRPFIDRGSRQAEALFIFGESSLGLHDDSSYLRSTQRVLAEFPTDPFVADVLNSLGTYYLKQSDEERADDAFRRLYDRFPKATFSERAAWKAGWRAYRTEKYLDTIAFFENAAVDFPRSDYRPAWLYWAARAHEKIGNRADADIRYALVIADYQNSYYGRLASARVGSRGVAKPGSYLQPASAASAASGIPPNADVIRALLAAEMYDDALNELRFARRLWGDSPAIQATTAWTNQQQSRSETSTRRFDLLRGGMTAMRRAYPQFMAAGGEDLPRDVQTVIFPIAYWDLIRRHAATYNLDPYLMAALVVQESTFVADIRSHANAYGLMQLMPPTAREYAKKLQMPYSSRLLITPEANVRMGMAHFADQLRKFGAPHLVLASYNAGDRPVREWMATRGDIERDEFIDDIPYPETQGYVKKILGMADDYRRIYGSGANVVENFDKTPFSDVALIQPVATAVQARPVPPIAAPAKKQPAKKPAAPAPRRGTSRKR